MSNKGSPTVSTAQQARQYDLLSLPTSLDVMGSKKDFMMMLQDVGTMNKKRKRALTFNKIGSWVRDWIKRVTPYNIPEMPTNLTHAKEYVVDIILLQHKIVKCTEVYCELLERIPSNGSGANNGNEVCILKNEKEFCGYDALVRMIIHCFSQNADRFEMKHTFKDVLHLASILDCAKSDMSHDPDDAVFDQFAAEFKNPEGVINVYPVEQELLKELDKYVDLDTNDVSVKQTSV